MNKKTILIIEDNEMNMEIAALLLENVGLTVLKAENGDSGIHIAMDAQPSLVLIDIHLPIKDGFEICKILKSDPLTAHIPLVAFTALVMEGDRRKALQAGCVGVISKPIEVTHFAEMVCNYLMVS